MVRVWHSHTTHNPSYVVNKQLVMVVKTINTQCTLTIRTTQWLALYLQTLEYLSAANRPGEHKWMGYEVQLTVLQVLLRGLFGRPRYTCK